MKRLPGILLRLMACSMLMLAYTPGYAGQPAKQSPKLPIPSVFKKLKPMPQLHLSIRYNDAGQQMTLYEPLPDQPRKQTAIIFVHGGGWAGGDRIEFLPWAEHFASQGYVSASINYRLTPLAWFPQPLDDVKDAVRWMKSHAKEYRIDPHRIVLVGYSAGGHLALMTALDGEEPVAAVASFAGPTELADKKWTPALQELAASFLHGTDPKKVSPIEFARQDAPPILLFQGKLDGIVPPHQALHLAKALKQKQAPVQLRMYPDVGHEIIYPASRRLSQSLSELATFIQNIDQQAKVPFP